MSTESISGTVFVTAAEQLAALQAIYGVDKPIRVSLEPQSIMDAKIAAGKEQELWVENPEKIAFERGDGKFCRADYVDRGGWGQIEIYEEPNVQAPLDGSPRIVGRIYLLVNSHGYCKVRSNVGLNGPILEANPTSISKDEHIPPGARITRRMYVEMNPQRLAGVVEMIVVFHEYPDEEGMPGRSALNVTTDARLICAIATSGVI